MRRLIRETLWIRDLHAQCVRKGIPMGHLSTLLRRARALVDLGRFESAGHRLREVKLDLLAQLLLDEEVPQDDGAPGGPGSTRFDPGRTADRPLRWPPYDPGGPDGPSWLPGP